MLNWKTDGSGYMKPMPTTHGMEAVTIIESAVADCFYECENVEEILTQAAAESDALMAE